jgi:tRNA modification GTPase
LLIAMYDSSRPLDAADLDVIRMTKERAGLAILNKRDLPAAITASDLRDRGLTHPVLPLSAINLADASVLRAELTKAIASLVAGSNAAAPSPNLSRKITGEAPDQIAISRERHRDALAMALQALKNAHHAALAPMPPEIVAVDIMAAASALGAITGDVSSEDVLDAIFRDFCIGK